jgi:hypothetical protein
MNSDKNDDSITKTNISITEAKSILEHNSYDDTLHLSPIKDKEEDKQSDREDEEEDIHGMNAGNVEQVKNMSNKIELREYEEKDTSFREKEDSYNHPNIISDNLNKNDALNNVENNSQNIDIQYQTKQINNINATESNAGNNNNSKNTQFKNMIYKTILLGIIMLIVALIFQIFLKINEQDDNTNI